MLRVKSFTLFIYTFCFRCHHHFAVVAYVLLNIFEQLIFSLVYSDNALLPLLLLPACLLQWCELRTNLFLQVVWTEERERGGGEAGKEIVRERETKAGKEKWKRMRMTQTFLIKRKIWVGWTACIRVRTLRHYTVGFERIHRNKLGVETWDIARKLWTRKATDMRSIEWNWVICWCRFVRNRVDLFRWWMLGIRLSHFDLDELTRMRFSLFVFFFFWFQSSDEEYENGILTCTQRRIGRNEKINSNYFITIFSWRFNFILVARVRTLSITTCLKSISSKHFEIETILFVQFLVHTM